MDEKLRKARRVLAVQSLLDDLAKARLIDLRWRTTALEDQQRSLHRFMSGETDAIGMFSCTVARRLQILAKSLAVLAAEQEAQSSQRLEECRRLRAARRTVSTLEADIRSKDTLRHVAEVIEAALHREYSLRQAN